MHYKLNGSKESLQFFYICDKNGFTYTSHLTNFPPERYPKCPSILIETVNVVLIWNAIDFILIFMFCFRKQFN